MHKLGTSNDCHVFQNKTFKRLNDCETHDNHCWLQVCAFDKSRLNDCETPRALNTVQYLNSFMFKSIYRFTQNFNPFHKVVLIHAEDELFACLLSVPSWLFVFPKVSKTPLFLLD